MDEKRPTRNVLERFIHTKIILFPIEGIAFQIEKFDALHILAPSTARFSSFWF